MEKNSKGLERISSAISLIFIGTLFLLINFDYFTFGDIFRLFATFWPLLIVLWGIKILCGVFPFGKVLNLLLDILVDLLIIYMLVVGGSWQKQGSFYTWVEDQRNVIVKEINNDFDVSSSGYVGVEKVEYSFDIGASKFSIDDTGSKEYLLVTGAYPEAVLRPEVQAQQVEGILNIDFTQSKQRYSRMFPFYDFKNQFDFTTLGDVVSSYDVKLGAGQGDIVLNSKLIEAISLNVGAGEVTLDLGDEIVCPIDVNVGAGKMTITIPKEVSFEVEYNVGVGEFVVTTDAGSQSYGGLGSKGTYRSKAGNPQFVIKADLGAGNLEIIAK
ncbi:hypothetical protein HYV12_03650 [Candidatus Dojkabacteria bacterium]|nr:hypothetical protein [Candidatus Dojkabacteria bacterium]